MANGAEKPRHRFLLDFLKSPPVLVAISLVAVLFSGMLVVSLTKWHSGVILPLLSPFLVFCLFGILIETPWFLSLLGRAFLSKESLDRMSIPAREELRILINKSIAGVSDDPLVEKLCETLAHVKPDLLAPYLKQPRIEIEHRPYGNGRTYIKSTVRQHLILVNPRKERVLYEQPFRTDIKIAQTADGKPTFTLITFLVRDPAKNVLVRLGPDSVKMEEDSETGEYSFTAPIPETYIEENSFLDIWFVSQRIIPFHDIYQYFVQARPAVNLELSYDYERLKAAHPDVVPQLWLYPHTAEIDRMEEEAIDYKMSWRLDGWLVAGDGFALSW